MSTERSVDCIPAAAKPGEIVQLIVQVTESFVLKNLSLTEGFEVVTVLVGRQAFPAPDWKSCYGQAAPAASFLMVLAKNATSEHKVARGTWLVGGAGGELPQPKPSVAAPQAVETSLPSAQKKEDPPSFSAGQQDSSMVRPEPLQKVPLAVTPGTNEVCVLLQRSECQRLLEVLRGGYPISEGEKPSILRQLEAAMTR
jgi:hypothetical protein